MSRRTKKEEETTLEISIKQSDYNFINSLHIQLILVQIFQFLNEDDIQSLSKCDKHIYHLYCSQIKKLTFINGAKGYISKIPKILDKYKNLNQFNLRNKMI